MSAPTTTAARRDDEALIERARIAYAKAGHREQPGSESDVTDVNGTTIITLRNVNGFLAMYRLRGNTLKLKRIHPNPGAA